MEFLKIQVTKKNTLNMVYKNDNGDIVTVAGANIVHKDLKAVFRNLIPHIALMTEQREVVNKTLKDVEACKFQSSNDSAFRWMTVDCITLSDDCGNVSLSGNRILQTGDVIRIESPRVQIGNTDRYQYTDDLGLAVQACVYEAQQYLDESKWGMREESLDFSEDPFEGKVTSDQVPQAEIKPVKKTRKTKKEKAA